MTLLFKDRRELENLLRKGDLRVAVYGMGGVGLAIATVWIRAGAKVLGVDIDDEKVRKLNRGIVTHAEEVVVNTLKNAIENELFRATTDGVWASKESDLKIVIVPLLLKNGIPDFNPLKDAITKIGRGLKRGDVVVVETSVPPGTTEGLVREILERESSLKAEDDFGLAYSPERVMIGRAVEDIEERYPKIVAGIGPRSAKVVEALYSLIAKKGVIVLSNPKVAELEKLVEGVYRDVNIALANEIWRLCNELGVDYSEVLRAANSQPYCHLHKPGVGVGGICIPIYPQLLLWKAKKLSIDLELVMTARKLNEDQPRHVLHVIKKSIKSIRLNSKAKIVIMGLSYRGDIGDTRMSPTYKLIDLMIKSGFKNIVVHDPYVKFDEKLTSKGIPLTSSLEEALHEADVIVIATDHSEYKELSKECLTSLVGKKDFILIDTKQVVSS